MATHAAHPALGNISGVAQPNTGPSAVGYTVELAIGLMAQADDALGARVAGMVEAGQIAQAVDLLLRSKLDWGTAALVKAVEAGVNRWGSGGCRPPRPASN